MIDIKKNVCFIITVVLSMLILLLTDSLLNKFPIIKYLFTDKVNYILLIILVVFIMLIDLYCGIVLGLVVLYMTMYINKGLVSPTHTNAKVIANTNANLIANANALSSSLPSANPNSYPDHNINLNPLPSQNPSSSKIFENVINNNNVTFDNQLSIINNNDMSDDNLRSDSEFIYNNTKPFPNKNLKPFQPKREESFISQQYQNEFMTNVGEPDRSGYDITGCRYDMKNSPQNMTKNGPPLNQCNIYDTNKAKVCGTFFYPLNA